MIDQPRRRACNHCTSQKLRCVQTPGSDSCARCLRIGIACVFSFSRRGMRPQREGGRGTKSGLEPRLEIDEGLNAEESLGGSSTCRGLLVPDLEQRVQDMMFSASTLAGASADIITNDPWDLDGLDTITSNFDYGLDSSEFRPISGPTNHGFETGGAPAYTTRKVDTPNNPTSQAEPLFSPTVMIRQVAELSVDLYKHQAQVPPLSLWDLPTFSPKDIPKEYLGFAIDHTFQLTQTLVDVYPQFLHTVIRGTPEPPLSFGASSQDTDSFLERPDLPVSELNTDRAITPCGQSGLHLDSRRAPPLDNASILLILSCHLRLIEIWEVIFGHVKECVKYASTLPADHPAMTLRAPQLRVGSYIPPPSAAVPMQVMLLIFLIPQLVDRATDMAKEVGLSTSDDQVEGLSNMNPEVQSTAPNSVANSENPARAACRDVNVRARKMLDEMNRLKPVLMQLANA